MKHRGGIAIVVAVLGLLGWMGVAGLAGVETAPGDLNKSGVVDAADLVLLANYQAGNLDPLPAQYGYIYEEDSIVGNLRYVPAGTFTQGSPAGEPCRGTDETQFSHTLTRNIAVMATEVTRRMWAGLLAVQPTLPADPTNTDSGAGPNHPVQQNTWHEAVLFANLLSLQQGLTRCYYKDAGFTDPVDAFDYTSGSFYCDFDADGYRLPLEGEWERCCRAGTAAPFWVAEPNYTAGNCGSATTPGMYPALETAAWFKGNNSPIDDSSPAGTKVANPWGLYDTHGNVWEWCWDRYQTAYPAGTATDYEGPASGSFRVLRGGCWYNYARYCRSAGRGCGEPVSRNDAVGFRLARSLP